MAMYPYIQKLREFFQSHSAGLVCAYLFGSAARRNMRPDSDVDIAVLYENDPPATLEGAGVQLAGDLERRLGKDVDVVVLNRARVELVHRVLRDGIIVLDRDRPARIRFEVRARNEYFDIQPILQRYRRGIGKTTHG